MILKILGVIFIIVVCVVAFFVWKFYRYIKKHTDSDFSTAISVLPQMDMELELSNAEEWKEVEQLEYTQRELKKIGATHVGYFCVYNGYSTIRVSMWNFKDQAVAVIYEALSEHDPENVTFIQEVSCKLHDGSICVTSHQHAVYENRPENHRIIFKESGSIVDYLKSIKAQLPQDTKILRIEDPKSYFMECYEEISAWGWRSESLHSDKTQQVFSSLGLTVTEEMMSELVTMGENYNVQINIERSKRLLTQRSTMSADTWEKVRDKLVFINEGMQIDHLLDAAYDLSGELTEAQMKVLDGFRMNSDKLIDPIGAFQLLLQSLNLKVKRVTSMEYPVKTEVYLPL